MIDVSAFSFFHSLLNPPRRSHTSQTSLQMFSHEPQELIIKKKPVWRVLYLTYFRFVVWQSVSQPDGAGDRQREKQTWNYRKTFFFFFSRFWLKGSSNLGISLTSRWVGLTGSGFPSVFPLCKARELQVRTRPPSDRPTDCNTTPARAST